MQNSDSKIFELFIGQGTLEKYDLGFESECFWLEI